MDITAYANTVRDQYQSVLQGLKNGSVSSKDALDYHYAEAQKVRGLSVRGVARSVLEYNQVRPDVPAEIIEKIQEVLANMDHSVAARTYQNAGGEGGSSLPNSSRIPQFINHDVETLRNSYQTESHKFLSQYANQHPDEWAVAAKELGYNINGFGYPYQFYDSPKSVGLDVSEGIPKSKAEDIFRHIAYSSDIAEFEAAMAPHQKALDASMVDFVATRMEDVSNALDRFAPHIKDMEAAGITPDDFARTLLTRDQQGAYYSVGNFEKGEDVARFVNGNAEVRALFDVHWNRTSNQPDVAQRANVKV
jgi:hypothetical protein